MLAVCPAVTSTDLGVGVVQLVTGPSETVCVPSRTSMVRLGEAVPLDWPSTNTSPATSTLLFASTVTAIQPFGW